VLAPILDSTNGRFGHRRLRRANGRLGRSAVSVLRRRLAARPLRPETGDLYEANDVGIEDRIAIQDGITIGIRFRKDSCNCCTTQSADGCRVTLKCRIRRRPCSITKRQYNTRNAAVGTVNKSKPTMASR